LPDGLFAGLVPVVHLQLDPSADRVSVPVDAGGNGDLILVFLKYRNEGAAREIEGK
jgi:hypothetical protein